MRVHVWVHNQAIIVLEAEVSRIMTVAEECLYYTGAKEEDARLRVARDVRVVQLQAQGKQRTTLHTLLYDRAHDRYAGSEIRKEAPHSED